jgi:hypothetical protein
MRVFARIDGKNIMFISLLSKKRNVLIFLKKMQLKVLMISPIYWFYRNENNDCSFLIHYTGFSIPCDPHPQQNWALSRPKFLFLHDPISIPDFHANF